MSQCFRKVSNKFTTVNSLLNTRKHVTQLDRHLPYRIKPSTFLEEFLNTRSITSAAVSRKRKLQEPAVSSLGLFNTCDAWRDAFEKEYKAENKKRQFSVDYKASVSSLSPVMPGVKRYEISSDDIVPWGSRCDDPKALIMNKVESLEKTHTRLSSGITILKTNDSILSNFEKNVILFAEDSGRLNAGKIDTKQTAPDTEGKPSQEQLQHVYDILSNTLPNLFSYPLDYSIYHRDVQFINNIRGTVTRGILSYVKQMLLLRTIGHLRFAYVKLEILKMTLHPEDDSIKIRWRIYGISGLKALVLFWKIKLWKMTETFERKELWYDGFSTFYVAGDGLIYKHVADKVMPDKDETPVTKNQPAVAAKLALFLGLLVPSEGTLSEIHPLISVTRHNCSLVKQLNEDKMQCLTTDLLQLEKLK